MDFPTLERFKTAGMETAGYDALTWYWPEAPEGALASDLYLAQDFFGVRERLESLQGAQGESYIVPPIVPAPLPRQERSHVLVNLGGLQNPFWSVDDAALYAKKVTDALAEILPEKLKVKITTSNAISERIGTEARVYPREEMKEILAGSRFAFMTPGLGNIYDSAIFDIPTIWLPPANDSQGQQLCMLEQHGMVDGAVHWPEAPPLQQTGYRGTQPDVLAAITKEVHGVTVEQLSALFSQQLEILNEHEPSQTLSLLERFGAKGDRVIAAHISQFARTGSGKLPGDINA
jgi:hypothetical protein